MFSKRNGLFATLILLGGFQFVMATSAMPATVPASFTGIAVTAYGAKCDGQSNDSAAFSGAIKAAASKCTESGFLAKGQNYISLPGGATCKINSGITIDTACVGLEGNGSTIDASGVNNGAAITLTSSEPANPYSANTARVSHFLLTGPGANTSTVGLQINAGGIYTGPVNIANFGIGVQFGSYAFDDRIVGSDVWNTSTGFNCPAGLTDAGELLVIDDGRIFNSSKAISNSGCEFSVSNTAIDGMSKNAIENSGGTVYLRDVHIEFFSPITGSPIEQDGGCNAWSMIEMDGGRVQMDNWNPNSMHSLVDNTPTPGCGSGSGPWIRLSNVFISGIQPSSGSLVTGTSTLQVQLNCLTNGAGGGTMCNSQF
jgi:hypothetical protein